MKKREMKEKVLEHINKNDCVSYAELEWLFERYGYDYKGDVAVTSGQCDHVIFWSGWRQEAFDIMHELIQEEKIHRKPTTFLNYLIDGAAQSLPLAKRAMMYKTDHWLPTVFCKGPDPSGAGRKVRGR